MHSSIQTSVRKNSLVKQENPSFGYPRWTKLLFFAFALYLVLPIVDIPLLGLSISAPIFFTIAVPCVLKPPEAWLHTYRRWITFALLIWFGIFFSAFGNGLLSGGVDINSDGIAMIIRYAYWVVGVCSDCLFY
jgi:hypothetical protein